MKISIVVPTIGSPSPKIISESLTSAINSEPSIWTQIIVIDNSKGPHLSQLLQEFADKDPRIQIHKVAEQMNMAECWNCGLNLVKEDWVLFLHDDDILLSSNLDTSLLNREDGFINFGFEVFENENWTYKLQHQGIEGIVTNTPKLVSTIINTQKLQSIGGWDSKSGYYLDFFAFIKLHSKFGSTASSKILGRYRLHPLNASAVSKRNQSYGDALPYVLAKIFEFVKDEQQRRDILFSMISFSYPNNTSSKKAISKLAKLTGNRAWLK